MHPSELTVIECVRAITAGELTARTLAEALFERIEAEEPRVRAWAHLERERTLAMADAADARRDGMLRGVPFAAKDIIDTADMPTAYGSPIHTGARPVRDAACVALFRLEGAVLLGKTVTTEFAHRHPGPTTNPFNARHTPGGSSSGSAAAVAARMAPVAFGTQTTGSVIRPAAYCGVVGYKPTHGDFILTGVQDNSPSFDTLGLMTRSVADLALLRTALLGGDATTWLDQRFAPGRAVPLAGLRIAICRFPCWERAGEEARQCLLDTARHLEGLGARVTDFDDRSLFEPLAALARTVSGFEFARALAHERLHGLDQLSAVLREGRMADGLAARFDAYRGAKQTLERLRRDFDQAMRSCDITLSLPAPGAAPEGLARTGEASFNLAWTTLHTPAITLPLHRAANGLPIGIQLSAARGADDRLLEIAHAVLEAFESGTLSRSPAAS